MSIKKTYERILFMIIGALIAFFAYLLGDMDSSISAKEYHDPRMGNVVTCDNLFVRDTVIIGDPDKLGIKLTENTILIGDPNKSSITLTANSESSGIAVSHVTTTTDSNYVISSTKDGVIGKYLYGNPKNPDSLIQFTVENDGSTSMNMVSSIGHDKRLYLQTFRSGAFLSISDAHGKKMIDTLK